MPSRVKLTLNKSGFNEYMNSQQIQDLLQELGNEVVARAEANTKIRATHVRNPDPYVARVATGRLKAVCFIWTANPNGILAEIHDRTLSKALLG